MQFFKGSGWSPGFSMSYQQRLSAKQGHCAQCTTGTATYKSPEMIRCLLCIVSLFLISVHALHAQEDNRQQILYNQIYAAAEQEYGMHQELINGQLYKAKNENVIGDPYFLNFYSNDRSVVYRGKHFENLKLRYDIFDQEILLIYLFNNTEYKLYLQKELITNFTFENKTFINRAYGAKEDTRFYQVIGQDFQVKVLYYWTKGIANVNFNNPDIKYFTPKQKETYLLFDNELIGFNRNRSFAGRFSVEHKKAIKKYLRQNKVKVNLATDSEMELLVEYIHRLGR